MFEPKQGISDKAILPIAFINATIHIDKNNTIKDGIFIIKGKRIIKVGKDITIPENAIVYDINGKHIYHSFIELYSSLNILKEKPKSSSYNPQYKSTKKAHTTGMRLLEQNIMLLKIYLLIKILLNLI